MVTAETAVVLPVLLLVLAGAVAAVTVVGAQLRCVDAAREGARAAARGEDVATVRALVATGGTGRDDRRGGRATARTCGSPSRVGSRRSARCRWTSGSRSRQWRAWSRP